MSVDVPATPWQDPVREVEYEVTDSNDIVDPDGNTLIDPDENQIVDTGVDTEYMAETPWEEHDDE